MKGHALAILLCLLTWSSDLRGAEPVQTDPLTRLSAQLSQAEKKVRVIDQALDRHVEEGEREMLRARAQTAQTDIDDAIAQLQERLVSVDIRVRKLGPVAAGMAEAPDIRHRRFMLLRERGALDAVVKRGKLVRLDAEQLHNKLVRKDEDQFSQKLTERSPSPLSPAFWSAVGHAFPRDIQRVAMFGAASEGQATLTLQRGTPWPALGGLTLALLVFGPGQLVARRLGRRLLTEGMPGRRVRRSANALLRIAVGTIAPLLASTALVQGAAWAGLLPRKWEELADAFVIASTFAGLTISILGALLMSGHPSWRMPPISDHIASAMRPFSLILGGLAFFEIMLTGLNRTVDASVPATAAGQALTAFLHLLLIGATLFTLGRLRSARARQPDATVAATHAGWAAVLLLVWISAGAALLALLLGYIGLSLFLVQTIAWSVVLAAGAYLMMMAVDDVATTVLDRSGPVGVALVRGLGVRGSIIDQAGVLISGILRLAIGVLALGLLLSPFGGGGGFDVVFGRLSTLAQGFQIGGVAVSPSTILRGIIVLFVGLALVRAFAQWLDVRYLPSTDLDGSSRNSVSVVARYVGVALAAIWALASLGVGVEKIAILLSALSVGIGFGLQAITQNFVSGLVLLAERPIRIGDLVRIGTDEGDVRRIRVRSTEIELADHSILVVPNSELITKPVLNKTMADAFGRVQIQFSAPIGTDVKLVRAIVIESFESEGAILNDPAPSFFVDSIADGRILFNSFAHVADPRMVQKARSNVFMMLLGRFREEGVEIGTVPQQLQLVGAPVLAQNGDDGRAPADAAPSTT